MKDPPTNLRTLRRSRKTPQVGDVFAMLPPDGKYLFGRVILTDALWAMKANLVYVYAVRSDVKKAPEKLDPYDYLIYPIFTNKLGWYHGRFETIENRPLGPDDVLDEHCFHGGGIYYDEQKRRLEEPAEPCGVGGLASYRMIDDLVSDALGIPRVPVDEE